MNIEAMKLALEALEEPKEHIAKHRRLEAITALRQAIEQENVDSSDIPQERVDETAKQRHEPVVWMYQDKISHAIKFQKHMSDFVDHSRFYETPLYTTPPTRQWVGLTDEEMHECWDSPLTPLGMKYARMIEAKLREKNT